MENVPTKRSSTTSMQERGSILVKSAKDPKAGILRKKMRLQSGLTTTIIPKKPAEEIPKEKHEEIRRNMKISDTISAVISLLAIIVAFIDEDIFWQNNYKSNDINWILRCIVSFSVLINRNFLIILMFQEFFIYRHYRIKLDIQVLRKLAHPKDWIICSNLKWNFIFESIYSWIHPPPGIDITIQNFQLGQKFEVSLNAYICALMVFRLHILLRLFEHYAQWTNLRAQRICRINGFQASPTFAIKAYLRYKAYLVLLIALAISVFTFANLVRLFEKPFTVRRSGMNFETIWNAMWCIIVTMATIGYGDIFPETHLGRLVTIMACMIGIFLLSLFVVTLTNTVELQKSEKAAYGEINKSDLIKKVLLNEGAVLIQQFFRLRKAKKEGDSLVFHLRTELYATMRRFKLKRRAIYRDTISMHEILNSMDIIEENGISELVESMEPLQYVMDKIDVIQEKQNYIRTTLNKSLENCKMLTQFMTKMNSSQVSTPLLKPNNTPQKSSSTREHSIYSENQDNGHSNREGL